MFILYISACSVINCCVLFMLRLYSDIFIFILLNTNISMYACVIHVGLSYARLLSERPANSWTSPLT